MAAEREHDFSVIVARTNTTHTPKGPHAFDCVQLTVVRSGSAILFGEFGHRHLNIGNVALIAPSTLFGIEPESWATITTLYIDRDFLLDQIFWQHANHFSDRFDTQDFLDTNFRDPALTINLGEKRVGHLMPWLDELVALSVDGPDPERFYRIQSLFFSVLDVLAPSLVAQSASRHPHASVRPTLPRHRPFIAMRAEAREAAEMLREALAEHWTLDRLAKAVHLSPSQVGRVFRETFGKTPIAYLTMLRAEQMAHLLRTTDDSIATIAEQVGWTDPDYAGRLFRRSIGLAPRKYRVMSRRIPAAE
ncbi:Helix-turn-helix domain-containing protein [Brevibacterium aurantiacum]|uniref:Helix-turn-helix domain-containing protein n=1 Tax=Brevibacterium aurantiacum TaxID=273384 RepID=A0A2H1IRF8_BREAU|nr:helix-turn-helix transcriptional regulator [Brevibacterium aurantiacum]SMX77787.1 Helix-turn-helix domain-containing protein [Brevibacterium aurantiacum]